MEIKMRRIAATTCRGKGPWEEPSGRRTVRSTWAAMPGFSRWERRTQIDRAWLV